MIEQIPLVSRELLEALAHSAAPGTVQPTPGPVQFAVTSLASSTSAYSSRLRVEAWLQELGIAYRVKAEPDGKGRQVYVLQCCPFHAEHGDPDSCIMQASDGRMSAHCFHNSCHGRGWQDFKNAIGAPEAQHYDPPLSQPKRSKTARPIRQPSNHDNSVDRSEGTAVPAFPVDHSEGHPPDEQWPRIQGNRRQLRVITEQALQAIRLRNEPPTIFVRGEVLTRLRFTEEKGTPLCEPLTDAALRGVLARRADWTKLRDTKYGEVEEDAPPPLDVVKDLASLPNWPQLPLLDSVIETPVYGPTGTLVVQPGYHPEARLYYHPAANLDLRALTIPAESGTVDWARDFLLEEWLGDFPFKDAASKAHALAALLLPLVRRLIEGPTPLHLFDAPMEGTGKTLLASVISIVTTGRDVEAIAEAHGDEEWRKRITAVLAEGPPLILLDNISRTLDSGALASALTTRVWKDRILGVSKTVRLPNTATWLASGNNTRLSRELIRRTIWCRLDARTDVPWERKTFRHPNLIRWTKEHRSQLVSAALTLCQCWVAAGRPAGSQTLGMFESWAEVIGGILEVVGVPGLLSNAQEFRVARTDHVGEWRAFVKAWWDGFQEQTVGVEALYQLATAEKLLDTVLGDKGERSQRTKLGLALSRSVDQIFGEFRLEQAKDDHCGRQKFQLRLIPASLPSKKA